MVRAFTPEGAADWASTTGQTQLAHEQAKWQRHGLTATLAATLCSGIRETSLGGRYQRDVLHFYAISFGACRPM